MPTAPETMPATPRPMYATYILGRKAGVFKTHPRRGDVINAIHLRTKRDRETGKFLFDTDITIYILLGDEYVTWMTLPAGADPSEYPELFKS